MKKYIIHIFIAAAFLYSCDNDFDTDVNDVQVTSGNADFSKFVALGNSLTAGYADGALYQSGQVNSYPAIIGDKMTLAGGGNFTQPLMPDDIGGFANLGVQGKFVLSAAGLSQLDATSDFNLATQGPYQNMGVPGAKTVHLIAPNYGSQAGIATGTANPYFARFASSATTSVLADAVAQSPTFFSLWIGNNDVLGYATAGGDDSVDQITTDAEFEFAYTTLVDGLTLNGAKGVLASLPLVTSIPYFTTVPYNALSPDALGGDANINALNQQLYGPLVTVLNAIGQGSRISLLSTTEANPILIKDESLTDISATLTGALMAGGLDVQTATIFGQLFGQARQTTSDDLVCLTAQTVLGQENPASQAPVNINGVTFPLEDRYVLTAMEVAECNEATNGYNNIISNLASENNLAFYDAKSDMERLLASSGITYNGTSYTSTFVSGGAFSLDGVHPTSRGYAIIANGFINAINSKYRSNLPEVNPNNYPGVAFP